MTTFEASPRAAETVTEYEALVAAAPAVLEAIPGAVYLCDQDGWLVGYNAEAAMLWGRSPPIGQEQFCGSHRLFLTDGTLLPREMCPMAAAVQEGSTTRNAEVMMERPDGSRIVALVNIRPLRDHQGRIQGAINCFQDITARKRTEEQLRKRSRDLDDFFENSAVGLHVVSAAGIILRANQAELDLLGYTAEEYVGRHIAEFHADPSTVGKILNGFLDGGPLVRVPAQLRAKDGSIKNVLITSNGRFEEGRFVSTRCFTIDVTDLERMGEQLRDGERHMRELLDALPAALYTTDAEGRITFYNKAAVELAGRTPQLGDQWCVTWRLYRPDGTPLPHDQCPMAVALKENRAVRGVQAIAERPDGTRVPFIPYPTPLRDASGSVVGAVNMLVPVA